MRDADAMLSRSCTMGATTSISIWLVSKYHIPFPTHRVPTDPCKKRNKKKVTKRPKSLRFSLADPLRGSIPTSVRQHTLLLCRLNSDRPKDLRTESIGFAQPGGCAYHCALLDKARWSTTDLICSVAPTKPRPCRIALFGGGSNATCVWQVY